MCLILFALRSIPGVGFQLAANRDEFFARPTSPANWWTDHPSILAGRDLRAGGTWLGISRSGRFAAITNFRDPASRRDDAPSRGALAGDFLLGAESPEQYLLRIAPEIAQYNGFSLLCGQARPGEFMDFWFISNRGVTHGNTGPLSVAPGVHGLSNHLLDEPWPKVVKGVAGLDALREREFSGQDHFALLADETEAAEDELPRTGVSPECERRSSAIRIRDSVYGTRCSTVLRIAANGDVSFHERSFDVKGEIAGTLEYRFKIS
ncbi:MAG: NRDE family protein [Burkholderiales bacterium]